MRTTRFDHAGLSIDRASVRRDSGGALVVRARFAASENVQVYGATRAYRPASEFFARDAMSSFEGALLMNGHVMMLETAADARAHGVGYVRGVRRDGDWLAGELVVTDESTIGLVLDGVLIELSAGYWSDDDERSGVSPRGDAYDVVMRQIRGNHVALLGEGLARAGRGARVIG